MSSSEATPAPGGKAAQLVKLNSEIAELVIASLAVQRAFDSIGH